MSDELPAQPTPNPEPPDVQDSSILGVSVRAWLALILISTVCTMSIMGKEVFEPLYTLAGIALGYYMGQKKQQ